MATKKPSRDWLDELSDPSVGERVIYERLIADYIDSDVSMAHVVASLAKSLFEEMVARNYLLEEAKKHTKSDAAILAKWQKLYDSARSQSNKLRTILQRKGAESGRHLSKKERLSNAAEKIGNSNSIYQVPNVVSISAGKRKSK